MSTSIETSEISKNPEETKDLPKLLIVDDDETMLSQLTLALEDDYRVHTASRITEALELIKREKPELITLDLALERSDPQTGFSVLERALAVDPLIKIVLITGNDTEENALRAVDNGAFDFFGKPVDVDQLKILLGRALSVARLERKNSERLRDSGIEKRLGTLLGHSEGMRTVFKLIRRVAPTNVAVLILGKSGTGKELVAREVHRLSKRSDQPFISINCGSIPENLLESELFGHEKGAFTGAHKSRPGKLEFANRGTVFLDEIGEMPLALQVKLLRFLQDHEIERVGGRTTIKLDVRIVAATNRDLKEEVKEGRFREDLFYRLSVMNINLPPLSERAEDILYLAEHFLDRFGDELGKPNRTLSRDAKHLLQNYAWPGNVRELEHHIQRAVLMSTGKMIRGTELELAEGADREIQSLREAREDADRRSVIEALQRTSGNVSQAARELEVSRPTMHDLMKKLDIDVTEYRQTPGRNDGDSSGPGAGESRS